MKNTVKVKSSTNLQQEAHALPLQAIGKRPLLQKVSREQAMSLSFAQEHLWSLKTPLSEKAAYTLAVSLQGKLRIAALQRSLDSLIQRHETLRTTFAVQDGSPVQMIHAWSSLPLSMIDLQTLPEDEREKQAHWLMSQAAELPYDLVRGPLLRVCLWQLEPEKHILLLGLHHLISDGWSIQILMRELTTLYEQITTHQPQMLPELSIQYADYAVWQRQWLQDEVLQQQIEYWKHQLAEMVPLDRPGVTPQAFQGAHYTFGLPLSLTSQLKQLSQREHVTLFMTLLGTFQILLVGYSGQEDIAVGTLLANRYLLATRGLIGLFANTLLLRTNLEGNPTFREVLRRVREVCLTAYSYQDLPFERLMAELQMQRASSHAPLFRAMLVLQNAPLPLATLADLTLRLLPVENQATLFDLAISLSETDQGLEGILEYNAALFEASFITRVIEQWQALLGKIIVDPGQQIADLLFGKNQRSRLLEERDTIVTHHDTLEETLASIWSHVLGLENVGIEANFFALGGHSLLATQVISRIYHTFGIRLSLQRFFQDPTIPALALLIRQSQEKSDTSPRDAESLLQNVDQLSDEEVNDLLLELLADEEEV